MCVYIKGNSWSMPQFITCSLIFGINLYDDKKSLMFSLFISIKNLIKWNLKNLFIIFVFVKINLKNYSYFK